MHRCWCLYLYSSGCVQLNVSLCSRAVVRKNRAQGHLRSELGKQATALECGHQCWGAPQGWGLAVREGVTVGGKH
jgi:hypothetical protein